MIEGWNEDGYFDNQSTLLKENGRAYLYLAANETDLPKKAQAFKAIKKIYVEYDKDTKLLVDADYQTVVLTHLNHPNKEVQMAAIEAAYPAVRGDNPDQAIIEALLVLGEDPEATVRFAALKSLGATSGETRQKNLAIPKLMLERIQDEPFVAALAIDGSYKNFNGDQALETEYLEALIEAMKNTHPVVRGEALSKYAKSNRKDKAEVLAQAKLMAKDQEAFPLAEALRVIGEFGDESDIPEVAKHLDDTRDNSYQLKFQDMTGKSTQTNHGGLTGHSVADAATRALDKLTDGRPDKGFEAAKVGYGKSADGDVAKNVAAAKAWMAQNLK